MKDEHATSQRPQKYTMLRLLVTEVLAMKLKLFPPVMEFVSIILHMYVIGNLHKHV